MAEPGESDRLYKTRPPVDDDDPFREESYVGIQTALFDSEPPTVTSAQRLEPSTFPNEDPWAEINECGLDQIKALAEELEAAGDHPRQVKMRQACFEAAEIVPGMRVLELGAGTGIVTRHLAEMIGRKGRVVGLDASASLLEYARQHVSKGAAIEYLVGDAYRLEFPSESFDATVGVTFLAHVKHLSRALRQMMRVTRPGGRVLLLEQDFETLAFDHSSRYISRRILQHGCDHGVVNPWCGRTLLRRLTETGLINVHCWPFVYAERGEGTYLLSLAERFANLTSKHEQISQDQAESWLQELRTRSEEGTFYGSLNYYFAFGEVP